MEISNRSVVEASLRNKFSSLLTQLCAPPAAVQKWSDELIARYTEPQRHYHTIDHIHSMLTCLDQNKTHIKNHTVVELAIYFHDWIYDPQAKDNELESIKTFHIFAHEINLDKVMTERVAGYIERTITHTLPDPSSSNSINSIDSESDSSDLYFFLDFDLEVLSRAEDDYDRYTQQIRLEYGHLMDRDYCVGRIEVLRCFLRRERLFFSETFYLMGERRARENLMREIGSLERELVEMST